MVLGTGRKRTYQVVREVLTGAANDVYVCQERGTPGAPYKTVWIVKDRGIVKALLQDVDTYCEEAFMQNEHAGFVFPYFQERPLEKFYLGTIRKGFCTRQQVWLALVEQCMVSGLPPAVVYLILNQGQVHIAPDGNIQFGFQLDLSEYNDSICERDNVVVCADQIAGLIQLEDMAGGKSAVRAQAKVLLEKKMAREGYQEFIQLYRDIRLLCHEEGAGGKRFRGAAVLGQDWLYRLLSAVCIALVCMVVVVLVGHLFFGGDAFWRLFGGALDRIGTETLLQ